MLQLAASSGSAKLILVLSAFFRVHPWPALLFICADYSASQLKPLVPLHSAHK